MLNPTPAERLCDQAARPYFLWDCETTLDEFRQRLADPDPEVRAYHLGKLMRQAKPDDGLSFATPRQIREAWPRVLRYLGGTRERWTWLFDAWEAQGRVWRR